MAVLFSNKNKSVCVLLLLSLSQRGYGQNRITTNFIDPYLINVTGSHSIINDLWCDWSVGEFVTQTHKIPSTLLLSCGYLQSHYSPLLFFQDIDSFPIQIKIGPNPFSQFIIIQSQQDALIINSIQLIDFQGILLHELLGDYAGHHFYYKIPIQKLNNPICFLKINYTIDAQIYKSKYFKLLQH